MKRPVERLGFLAGVLWAALTEDSPPRPSADAGENNNSENIGSYRTAVLAAYRPEARDVAERIFKAVAAGLKSGKARRGKGSYSFVAASGETMAKIIIYERGVGRVSENFPLESDGVYVLLRMNGTTTQPTVGVAPRYAERFTFRRVDEVGIDAAVQEIVAAAE